MLLNLTDVFTTEGSVEEKQCDYEKDVFTCQLGRFPIMEKTPVSLKLSNIGQEKALVEGSCIIKLQMQCDRCLKELEHTFEIAFSHDVIPSMESSEDDSDETEFMEGYNLDIETLIDNEILLNWPMKILCKDDCKGICKVCGKNLNEGSCGCDDFVPDPRMASIMDIFNQSLK